MEGLANVTNTERLGQAGGERLPCLASLLVLIWMVGAVMSWEILLFLESTVTCSGYSANLSLSFPPRR